jgi:hypothetical protein
LLELVKVVVLLLLCMLHLLMQLPHLLMHAFLMNTYPLLLHELPPPPNPFCLL